MEELGLPTRASNQNPSRINGAWNPKVRSELEKRLTAAGVDLSEPFYWNLRGKRTRIEIKRAPEIIGPARWAINNVVRDGKIHISDAIAYASFLRGEEPGRTVWESPRQSCGLRPDSITNDDAARATFQTNKFGG
jgi:hypothetical protein